MRIEQALFQYLTENRNISAIIGVRLYPFIVPHGSLFPAGTYTRIDTPRVYSHDGPSGLASPRMQLDWWVSAHTVGLSPALYDLTNAVRQALNGFKGTMGNVSVGAVFLEDERDSYDEDEQLYRRSQDYIIWHEE